mmetsp:Transcript_15826/g.30596  ORF Transcript_15826/g.30596 Transcript_15826/m.30596 type:complete len:185 (+) Transcript_15826:337-891(+)
MSSVPKCVVFDLDNLTWYPEMYHLWGGKSGSPFRALENGNVADRGGTEVYLMGSIREILQELDSDEKWFHTSVAVASTCDEPEWARECMQKIIVDKEAGRPLEDYIGVSEIHKGSKSGHFRTIASQTGVKFEEMVFFDDQRYNCDVVSKLGVTCYLVPTGGVTRAVWNKMLGTFPSPGKTISCR